MKLILSISLYIFLVSVKDASSLNRNLPNRLPFKDIYGELNPEVRGDPGEPLILTDLIKKGYLIEAQEQATVQGLDTDVKSYAGYFRVDEVYNSNIFFWFFPSQGHWRIDPVVLWLQGGPGASSLFGLFVENGPFQLKNGKLISRETAWTKRHSVIYIDQPAGTGWSFTTDGYARNQTKVATDLYEALHQFFTMFYQFQDRNFYIAGESYAGKYIPAIGYEIHKRNPDSMLKINLRGLAIGNGFTDPIIQIRYSEYVYQSGLVDLNTKNAIKSIEDEAVQEIKSKQFEEAFYHWNDILLTIQAATELDIYNYLSLKAGASNQTEMKEFLSKEEVRRAIHVGKTTFGDGQVYNNLKEDIVQSQADKVAELLKYYRILIYSGQTDIIVPYVMSTQYLENLKFPGSDEYAKTERTIWHDENDKTVVAGYVKTAGNLTELMVRNSGHMVPIYQPEWAMQLILTFTRNKRFQ